MARLLLLLLLWPTTLQAQRGPLVLAAASLQESMSAAADAWARRGHLRPVLSFASSSALARQIEAGAPADLFVSADTAWMDRLDTKRLLRPDTRANFIGNRLVLVANADDRRRYILAGGNVLARQIGPARLAMADPAAVPAGRYGAEALRRIGAWSSLGQKIARADSVRGALALIERRAAPLGIIYATDARASSKVRVVAAFPSATHRPIVYPLAVLRNSTSREAQPFRRFLLSPSGRAIFIRFGFRPL